MQIKKELLTGIIGALLIIVLTGYYANEYRRAAQGVIINTPAITSQPQQTLVLTTQEIAKHNNASDCWIIVNQSVYNVTNYLAAHPGGAGVITPLCGADATAAFNTKGGRGSHSSRADQDLASLKLGNVNQTVNISQGSTTPTQGTFQGFQRGRFEDD